MVEAANARQFEGRHVKFILFKFEDVACHHLTYPRTSLGLALDL